MTEQLNVLSIVDGLWTGGSRVVHTDVLTTLHHNPTILGEDSIPQHHEVLSLRSRLEEERMVDNPLYHRLGAAGIEVYTLGFETDHLNPLDYTPQQLEVARDLADRSDVLVSLKEGAPLQLIEQAGIDRPLVIPLHRSDPETKLWQLETLKRMLQSFGNRAVCIASAFAARDAYHRVGIPDSQLRVVINGIDLDRYKPSPERRTATREALGISEVAPVIIFSARFHPIKNVPLFLQSARLFLGQHDDAHIIMCGGGMAMENPKFAATLTGIISSDQYARIHALGIRQDMEHLYAAADIGALTSNSETSPLSLMEAMACGAVPVTTQAGDTPNIVAGGRGLLADNDPVDIARKWGEAYAARETLREAIHRDLARFDRRRMAAEYGQIFAEMGEG